MTKTSPSPASPISQRVRVTTGRSPGKLLPAALCLWCAWGCLLPAAAAALGDNTAADLPPERQILIGDLGPERRGNTIFEAARAAALLMDAQLHWDVAGQQVRLSRGERWIVFRPGDRFAAAAGGERITLPAAPYRKQGSLMIPVKAAAHALGVPVGWDARTDSLLVGPVAGAAGRTAGRQSVLPLETVRTGFVVHTPGVGSMVPTQVRVQVQANLPPGKELVLQLREADGAVLAEGVVLPARTSAGSRGRFGETLVMMGRVQSDDAGRRVRFVAFLRGASRAR